MHNLKKHCLITGASSGIGKNLAKGLKKAGYAIVSMQRTNASFSIDFSDPTLIEKVVNTYISQATHFPDLIVLNAGEGMLNRFIDIPQSSFINHININFISPLLLSQKFLKLWSDLHSGGHLIFIGSQVALPGGAQKDNALYIAAKAGIHGLVPSLALEYGPDIRVNCIAPGDVYTPLAKKGIDYYSKKNNTTKDSIYENIKNAAALKKWVPVEDILEAVLFLEKTSSMTGAVINISAGRTM